MELTTRLLLLDRRRVPTLGLLLYLGRPNLEAADVPIGDDTEIGDDTIIRWMFLLPADADIRAATGWVTGIGNIFYDAAGDPVAVLASEIAAWSSINQWNVLFHLVSADTETGRLAVYAQDTPLVILNKALKVLREDQIDVSPSAFFNGMDTTGKTSYTGGPTYAPDHLGVLRSPGANLPAIEGMRLDGTTYVSTDISGAPIVPSVEQKTRTGNADFSAFTPSTTFPRFDASDPLRMPGMLCEPTRTNKVTCQKANPVDITSINIFGSPTVTVATGQTSRISEAKLERVCTNGNLYKVTGTTGDVVSITGSSNTNPHSLSAYIAVISGEVSLRFDGVTRTAASGSVLSRVKAENITPSGAKDLGFIITAPGTDFYFILPQLEEGAFCTLPICKASDGSDQLTPLTRAATVVSFPTAGKIPVNNFAIRMIVVPRASGQSSAYCFGTYIDSNNYTAIIINPTSVTIRKRVSGISNDASVSITHANRIPLDLILYLSPATGIQVAGRAFTSLWGLFTDGAINATEAAKANAQIASIYQLGSLNGSSQFAGNISLFDCVPIPTGITDPMAWAKTHWGVA